MDTIILVGVIIGLCGLPIAILRRSSHRSNPCPRDSYGYHIPGIGGGVSIFGSDSPTQAERRACETIERITEVK